MDLVLTEIEKPDKYIFPWNQFHEKFRENEFMGEKNYTWIDTAFWKQT